jgi:hypothetical protein
VGILCQSTAIEKFKKSGGMSQPVDAKVMTSPEPQNPVPALTKMSLDENPIAGAAGTEHQTHIQRGEQIVNPFEIAAADEYGIDYDKLIETFGTRKIDQATLDRFERLTGEKPHRYLRRGHFFSQR